MTLKKIYISFHFCQSQCLSLLPSWIYWFRHSKLILNKLRHKPNGNVYGCPNYITFGPFRVVLPPCRSSRTTLYFCWKVPFNCQTKLALSDKRTPLSDKKKTPPAGDILHTRVVLPTRQGGPYNPTGWTLQPDRISPFWVDLITRQGGPYNQTRWTL